MLVALPVGALVSIVTGVLAVRLLDRFAHERVTRTVEDRLDRVVADGRFDERAIT